MSKTAPRPAVGALSGALLIAGATLAVTLPGNAVTEPATAADTTSSVAAQAGTLVTNGDFAQGKLGWRTPRATRFAVTSAGHGDSYVAQLRRPRRGAASLTDSPDVRADSVAGDEYLGSAFVRSSVRRLRGRLVIREIAANGRVVGRTRRAFVAHKSWAEVPYRAVAQADGSRFDIRVTGFRVTRKRALFVDDLSMYRGESARKNAQQCPRGRFLVRQRGADHIGRRLRLLRQGWLDQLVPVELR